METKDNLTASVFRKQIPLKLRTFTAIKSEYGQDFLKFILKTLTSSSIDKGTKRDMLYKNYTNVREELKDIIWETYIEKELGVSEEWD